MKETAVIVVASLLCGIVVGRMAGTFSSKSKSSDEAREPVVARHRLEVQGGAHRKDIAIPRLVTSETGESLLAQGEAVTYAGLALWMLDAEAGEIADYWARCPQDGLSDDIKRLIFINWTRLDPMSAIAATQGKEEWTRVWWAWAASDPTAALSAAGPEQFGRVAKGIGEFHPAWLLDHFSDIPDDAKGEALHGLTTWKENADPEGTLDFLEEKGRGFQSHIFKAFALKDPWGAFDWLEKNDKLEVSRYSGHEGPVEILIREMNAAHPDDLERMAAMMPAGKVKRVMEDAVFEKQVETDPEKALETARNTDAPLVAAKRLAMIGAGLLTSDPDKAFDIAADILAKSPNRLSPSRVIDSANGRRSSDESDGEAQEFFNELVANDPERTLDMAAVALQDAQGASFYKLTNTWAENDLGSYAEWVNKQSSPEVRKTAIHTMVGQLMNRGSHREAADWAIASPDPSMSLFQLAYSWGRTDPTLAEEWFQEANLTDEDRQKYIQLIKRP